MPCRLPELLLWESSRKLAQSPGLQLRRSMRGDLRRLLLGWTASVRLVGSSVAKGRGVGYGFGLGDGEAGEEAAVVPPPQTSPWRLLESRDWLVAILELEQSGPAWPSALGARALGAVLV